MRWRQTSMDALIAVLLSMFPYGMRSFQERNEQAGSKISQKKTASAFCSPNP